MRDECLATGASQSIVGDWRGLSNVVQDGVKAATEVWHATREAEQGIHRYGVLLSRLPPSVGNAVGGIQELVLRMEAAHAAVQEAAADPPAPVPRHRTSDELVVLLAASRFEETSPPPPAASAMEEEKPGLASASVGDNRGTETYHS